jgi:hypothetical protein
MDNAGRKQIEGRLMDHEDNVDKIIEELILSGGLEVSGLDAETGEPLYQFTDKLSKTNPEIAEGIQELFHLHVMALWEKGFLNMNPTELNPMVTLTDFALNEEAVSSLHPDLRRTLIMIIARFELDA